MYLDYRMLLLNTLFVGNGFYRKKKNEYTYIYMYEFFLIYEIKIQNMLISKKCISNENYTKTLFININIK